MASSKAEVAQIVKFDGSNFQLWKFSVNILLKAEKLVSIVEGKENEPNDKTSNAWKKWDERNTRAQVILLTTIDQGTVQSLINCETAAQMWKKLLTVYEQRTEISKELIWQQFYEYKMQDGNTIATHISKIESLVKQLKDVKEEVSNSAICTKALSSLPSKFNAFKTAWDSVAPENQTFENLTARFLKEEFRMTRSDDESSRLAFQALTVKSNDRSNDKKKTDKGKIQELKKTTNCNYCKKRGHWARECRLRIAEEKKKKPEQVDKRDEKKDAYVCDLISLCSVSSDKNETDWICDSSGASMHMTNQEKWFTELKPLKDSIAVRIANHKMIYATGIGTIEIEAFVHGQWKERTINDVLLIPELRRSLFSVGAVTNKGFTYHAFESKCEFKNKSGELSCEGMRKDNLWIMNFRVKSPVECQLTNANTLKLWHERCLGHVNFDTIIKSSNNEIFKDTKLDDKEKFFCEACQLGKQTRKSHPPSAKERVKNPGERNPTTRKIELSCDVNFDENNTYNESEQDMVNLELKFGDQDNMADEINEENVENQQNENIEEEREEEIENQDHTDAEPRRQLRNRETIKPPDYYGPYVSDYYAATAEIVPQDFESAVTGKDSENWHKAMKEEIDALQKNETWTLEEAPNDGRVVDCKWVYRVKPNVSGKIVYKARLVARGFNQVQGLDYTETFAPVVRYDSIRVLLALAAENNYKMTHFDIKTAFLYGDLQEDIYMKQPPGFENPRKAGKVCKLKKSLYGLKQSPRSWNHKFVSFLTKYDLKQLQSDQCVFFGRVKNDVIYLALYVDDGLVLSSSDDVISDLIKCLGENFEITIDKNAKCFVGLEITRENDTVSISQQNYIQKVLQKFNMTDCKPVAVPAEPGLHLTTPTEMDVQHQPPDVQHQPYREAVGCLIFLATVSRPDIAYAVSQVSRFLNNWTTQHWNAVKRILRYIKGTINFKIVYRKSSSVNLIGYSDADFAGCAETRKSTSGYLFVLAGGAVTWSSQKQSVVAQSTTESEYLALALGTKEALWLRSFLKELGFAQEKTKIQVDNQSAIKLARNPEFHKRTKHIDIRFHFVRDEYERGNIEVKYIPSDCQLADILIKPLSKGVHECLIKMLNLANKVNPE